MAMQEAVCVFIPLYTSSRCKSLIANLLMADEEKHLMNQ